MRPKRGETAEETIARWVGELTASMSLDQAIEYVDWLREALGNKFVERP